MEHKRRRFRKQLGKLFNIPASPSKVIECVPEKFNAVACLPKYKKVIREMQRDGYLFQTKLL